MTVQEENGVITYNPMAILHLFNNAISLQETKKLIKIKGIYTPGKGANYSGYYYDSLRDESSDASLTLLIPSLIRNKLIPNKTITFNGFITRRVVNNGGRIELQVTIADLIEQTHNKYSDDELKAIEVLQKKAAAGYRDVQSFIKLRIINDERIKIVILVGKTGIIDSDIKHQIRESINEYDIAFEKINLSSESEILSSISNFNTPETDILIVSRGGGENLDIFNKLPIAEACINLKPYFLTAIGHKEDTTLLQKVADKSFITPSEFGQFLNDIFNQTQEELQNSKAKLVESITIQLKANYEKQLQNLNEKLKAVEELKNKSAEESKKLHDEKIKALNSQIELLTKNHANQLTQTQQLQSEKLAMLQKQVDSFNQQNSSKDTLLNSYKKQIQDLESKSSVNWLAVIIAVVIGIVIGIALKK